MTNPDAFPRRYTFHLPCLLAVTLYETPALTGPPVFGDGLGAGGCKSMGFADTLASHTSVTYSSTSYPFANTVWTPIEQYGKRLPPGRYYAIVNVGISELTPEARTIPVGEVAIAAP